MSSGKPDLSDKSPSTVMAHAGRDPHANHGIVNPPVCHASTILFPTVAVMEAAAQPGYQGYRYGRRGTPTSTALEEAVAAVEGGDRTVSVSSGMAAVATALTAFTRAGDHILMTDSVYGPARAFCNGFLARYGVETTYYDPMAGSAIADLVRPNTTVVYTEAPGSQTFEVQDIPAIATAVKQRRDDIVVMMDNTWASPLLYQPFTHGVDLSIQAGTKYIVGHSDAMLGLVTTRDALYPRLKHAAGEFGSCAGPDDCYLALRGLRSMGPRLRQHQETGLRLAWWLRERAEVSRVLHPGLPTCPGHEVWKRDFKGASGLFGVLLKTETKAAVAALLDGMELFGMGYSWGGFESLMIPVDPRADRTAVPWTERGSLLRIHAGLEGADDLIVDLERGFERLNALA